ncbi:MAG: anti-sigma factor [Gemmatimonadetes bacterium]|nr:anti-sigma factor [Gemmatimonadota bacterium]
MKKHEGLNCDDCVEHLYTYLDGELTGETESDVRVHIEGCGDCFGHFEFERTFLRFLEARAKAQCAPEPLRRRIFKEVLLDNGSEAE